ncbi:MAG: hypothetical protein IBJ16_09410 [Chitinophagaceae bacterium]|nr:hypothetical protein [Chitinophagaceae bacterium]
MVRKCICLYALLIILFIACNNRPENVQQETAVVIPADSISELRSTIRKEAVITHQQKVPDEFNNWKFQVSLYETERRFHYIVRMQYKELRISDSINIPNLGKEPIVEIQKDSQPYSCTIGFLDKKGVFKPYYRANVQKEQLRFKKIAAYGVGVTLVNRS